METVTKPVGRGGPGRGQGRKPVYSDPLDQTITLRATAAQKRVYESLGGGEWLRAQLDAAGK